MFLEASALAIATTRRQLLLLRPLSSSSSSSLARSSATTAIFTWNAANFLSLSSSRLSLAWSQITTTTLLPIRSFSCWSNSLTYYETKNTFRRKQSLFSTVPLDQTNKTTNMDDTTDTTTRPTTTSVGEATTKGSTTTSTDNINNNETTTSNKRSMEDDLHDNLNNQKKQNRAGNHRPWEKKNKRKPSSEKERNRAKHSNYNVHVDERTTALGPHEGSFANPAMRQQFQIEWTVDDIAKEDTTVGGGADDDPEKDDDNNDKPEREETNITAATKKRKVALLVGFLGTKYGGFQVNMEQRTIQATLELALYRAGLIHGSNFGRPHKYTWSTSARTDKGVHACAQVCSLKVELLSTDEDDDNDNNGDDKNQKKQRGKNEKKKAANQQPPGGGTLESVRLRIQEHLPDDIGILDVLRCTRNFCAKTQRDRVRYSYMIPSFLFHPDIRSIFTDLGIPLDGREDAARAPLSTEEVQALQHRLGSYRSTPEQRASLQAALSSYQGTHSFHNFTKGVKPGQATANRYILEFTVEDPVVVVVGGGSAINGDETANDHNDQQQLLVASNS
jgi:tRNA pseudouridine38-40 synthase